MMQYEVPTTYNTDTGDLLYQWLGSFWSGICEDGDLIYKMMQGNGILSAQLYQEYVDTLNVTNRNKVPVFHRKMWFPITLHLQDRDNSDACGLKLDMNPAPVIGPQTSDPFEAGAVFKIGGAAPYKDVTAYKLDGSIKSIASITNNISNPDVIYLQNVNYIVKDSIIYFLNNQDPFDNPKFISKNINGDRQLVLWCVDTLVDRDYIYKYLGYVIGVKQQSSEEYKTAGNALWDVYNKGATLELTRLAISTILGEPAALGTETVVAVVNSDSIKQVVTDANVYTFSKDVELNSNIVRGHQLYKGEFFTDTIKFYTNLDPTRLSADGADISTLRSDIPALYLPPQCFRAELGHGISVNWEQTNIINEGIDKNGNYKYSFQVFGYPEDITSLWEDIWDYCEDNGIACESILDGYIHDTRSDTLGSTSGRISPLEFFLYNCLKANTLVITIDRSKLSKFGMANIDTLKELYKTLPAHVYTFVIEKISDICDNYDLGVGYSDETELSAGVGINSSAYYGKMSVENLTYRDNLVKLRWVPSCNKGNY